MRAEADEHAEAVPEVPGEPVRPVCGDAGPVRAVPVPDMINSPPHYRRGGMESIDVIEAFGLGFRLGNVVKYVLRADHKGQALQDLKKALWYLQREIDKRGG
jgi:hypothetical protein